MDIKNMQLIEINSFCDTYLDKIDAMIDMIDNIINNYNVSLKMLEIYKNEAEDIVNQIKILEKEYDITYKAIKVLQQISDERNFSMRKFLEDIINSALYTVFSDRNYKIKIDEYTHGSNILVRLMLVDENGVERSLNIAHGEGVKQLISFLLNVVMIIFSGARRVLILDEVFHGLHDDYARVLSDLLVDLTEKSGFQFLIVSHNKNLYANNNIRVIHLEKTTDGLIIKEQDS